MEYIEGPPAWLEWNGSKWYRNRHGYYQHRDGVLMHTIVWEQAHEHRVPDGQVVHHVDGNPGNNQPDNLRVMSRAAHLAEHGLLGKPHSPEARQAISQGQKLSWANRKPREHTCGHCAQPFLSTGQRAKFCGESCRTAFYREQHRAGR